MPAPASASSIALFPGRGTLKRGLRGATSRPGARHWAALLLPVHYAERTPLPTAPSSNSLAKKKKKTDSHLDHRGLVVVFYPLSFGTRHGRKISSWFSRWPPDFAVSGESVRVSVCVTIHRFCL